MIDSTFPGARVTPDDSRYPTLVRGFNQRWVGRPQYVQVVGSAQQIVEVVRDCLDRGLRSPHLRHRIPRKWRHQQASPKWHGIVCRRFRK